MAEPVGLSQYLSRPRGAGPPAGAGRRAAVVYSNADDSSVRKSRWGATALEFYVALILALSLAAVAGVLYYYLMFLEARSRQQRRRIAELERANAELLEELRGTRTLPARETEGGPESWPEVIDEDSDYSMS